MFDVVRDALMQSRIFRDNALERLFDGLYGSGISRSEGPGTSSLRNLCGKRMTNRSHQGLRGHG